jgi:hypothetical protein
MGLVWLCVVTGPVGAADQSADTPMALSQAQLAPSTGQNMPGYKKLNFGYDPDLGGDTEVWVLVPESEAKGSTGGTAAIAATPRDQHMTGSGPEKRESHARYQKINLGFDPDLGTENEVWIRVPE